MSELRIKLPDGSERCYESQLTCGELAGDISASLRKKSIAAKVNGKLVDLSHILENGDNVSIVLLDDDVGLEIIRHSTAHILAEAVKSLYPTVQVTIGPVIENGFFYDFVYDEGFSDSDLLAIEKKMKEIISRNANIVRRVVTKQEAIEYFQSINEDYKVKIIEELDDSGEISLYSQGEFIDLCRGPHLPSTGYVKAFKLTRVSGAYWKGDSKNKMLQRIYGTAWRSKKELSDHLTMLEEAKKRDHRKIGKEMDLFHFQDDAVGVPFWHPNGWTIFQRLLAYMKLKQSESGYLEIATPEIMDQALWKQSGHLDKFTENMFFAHSIEKDKAYAVRPMNCPGSVRVFSSELRSYRDLPMRLAEFGKVYRYEPSGALYGLMRVRGFTQDDAHIFCTEDQIIDESLKLCELTLDIYSHFGFDDVMIKFSDRPENRIGSDEVWDKAEGALLNAINTLNLDYQLNAGDGAFYGPKIEFVLKDCIGRQWQMGTLQVDLNLPERLDAQYIAADGQKRNVVMLHRAIFGSIERFIGILLEHYAGRLPFWLSPMQVAILSITDRQSDYANSIGRMMSEIGITSTVDNDNQTLSYKIRKYSRSKVSIIVIIGDDELENRAVSFRSIGDNKKHVMSVDAFVDHVKQLNAKGGMRRAVTGVERAE